MMVERAEETVNVRRTGWAVGKTGGDGGGGDGTGAASTSGTSRRKAPFRILPRSSAFHCHECVAVNRTILIEWR